MNKAAEAEAGKKGEIVRITDAHTLADLESALRGGGMFAGKRVVILEGVFANEEMRAVMLEALPHLKESDESFSIFEEKPDAATRKLIEKYAKESKKFDAPKKERRGDIFVLARALSQGDRKALWVGYQEALARKEAPEAIHGVLFWGAKQMFIQSEGAKRARAEKYVADLAELPHESRRKGVELEYALERYILGVNKS